MTANPPNLPTTLPPALEPLRTELGVFYRELPRLLAEREHGKYLLVKGETTYWVWDTSHDAHQYAIDKFGPTERFLLQKIDARMLAALAPVFGPHPDAPEFD